MKKLTLIILLVTTGCHIVSDDWELVSSKGGWGPHAQVGNNDIFTVDKWMAEGDYIPDRWEAELKYDAGMMSATEYNYYERVRSRFRSVPKSKRPVHQGGMSWNSKPIHKGYNYYREREYGGWSYEHGRKPLISIPKR